MGIKRESEQITQLAKLTGLNIPLCHGFLRTLNEQIGEAIVQGKTAIVPDLYWMTAAVKLRSVEGRKRLIWQYAKRKKSKANTDTNEIPVKDTKTNE